MTTPAERTRALIEAEKILQDIHLIRQIDRPLIDRIYCCLRHYPTRGEIAMIADESDMLSEPPKEPS